MKESVVLFPSVGMGHLIPAVELAKLFIPHNLSVTIILIASPFPTSSNNTIDSFISGVSSSFPLISFHRLQKPPQTPSPPPSNPVSFLFHHLRLANPLLSHFLTTLSLTSTIRALVLDMFCTAALDVANDLCLPAYIFFSSSASCLAVFLSIPKLQAHSNFKDLDDDTPVHIPGLPPIPVSHMPDYTRDRDSEAYKELLYQFERLPKADGIVINTFQMLEPRAIQALVDGMCACPVYCIGPLIADRSSEEKHECLKWLDEQPKGSVVFLCFGSRGSLSARQLKEIAIGLERSEQRFLWVVRTPRSDDPKKMFEPLPEPDLGALMPEGFIERTEGRGMVVKSWAPQAEVLGHEAVSGFVTHCGWNSILEAVSCGAAMIAWPLYAEQKMNKVVLEEEMKLGVEMKGYDKEVVSAEEVETKVRWLMESEGGRGLKDRAVDMKEAAVAAREEGGSSDKAWREVVGALLKEV